MKKLPSAVKGAISEMEVTNRLMKKGYILFRPVVDYYRYDLLAKFKNQYYRIQVKTGSYRNGVIRTTVKTGRKKKGNYIQKSYKGDVDYIAIFCFNLNRAFLVPIHLIGQNDLYLRVKPTLNNQKKGILWAKDFEL